MNSIYTKYIFELPIIPQVVSDILKIPGNSQISSKEIEDIIKIDPYLTSRLLKIANSSFYSRQREISSIKDAITLIGINKIKAICLLIAGSEIIDNKKSSFYKSFWDDAIKIAFIARSIAKETGKSTIKDDIFTAGILHNIGQGILYNFSNDKYEKVMEKFNADKGDISIYESEEFGIDNHEVASGVLKSWDFPDLHIDVVSNCLNSTSHSNFQGIVDVISISKLLHRRSSNLSLSSVDNDKLITYQSRLNLRTTQLDFYLKDFFNTIKETSYFKLCKEAIQH